MTGWQGAMHCARDLILSARCGWLDLSEQQGLIESTERCIQEMADAGYRISMDHLQKVRSDSRELNARNWLEH
jgi:predicted nucleic acid-binding protein